MEDLLVKYGIVLGRRYTLKQRQQFLLAIGEEFIKLGYKIKFANDEKKNNARTVDLFIGDIAKAKTIVCAHFDTPQKVVFPNFKYYPLNGQKSFKTYWLYTLIPNLIATLLGGIAIYSVIANNDFGGSWRPLFIFITVAVAFLLATLVSKGLSNKYNLNRNTASILAILELARKTKPTDDLAFILLDKGCGNNMGARMLELALPTTFDKKLFIYLDCIGNGENIVLAHKNNLAKEAEKLKKNFKGSQDIKLKNIEDGDLAYTPAYFFKRSITITNGYYNNTGDLYVKNTNTGADKIVDPVTIEAIGEMLANTFDN